MNAWKEIKQNAVLRVRILVMDDMGALKNIKRLREVNQVRDSIG